MGSSSAWLRKLRKLRRLPPAARRQLAEAWLELLYARAALRLRRFAWLRKRVTGIKGGRALDATAEARARRLARIVAMAARNHFAGMTCLHRSLALQRMLIRRGIDAQVRIGLRRAEDLLQGHAWLECGGAVINDASEAVAQYVPARLYGSRP